MFAVIDSHWCRLIYPKLMPKVRNELLLLLIEYSPKTQKVFSSFDSNKAMENGTCWCFPFVELPDDFDHTEYECWTEICEEEIAYKYGLPMSVFEC